MRSIRVLFVLLPLLIITSCGGFIHSASVADKVLAENAVTVRLAVDAAHREDCDLQTPGVQPCLSDADYTKARAAFSDLGKAGLAFGAALRAGNEADARTQAKAVIDLAKRLLDDQVVRLPADAQLVAQTALTTIQTVFVALNP